MNLSLNLTPSLELQQICILCGQSLNSHAVDCLQGHLKKLSGQILDLLSDCPKCYEVHSVLPNKDDYLECQKCHTLFTRSSVALGHDPDTLEKVVIHTSSEYFEVLVIPEKGKGDFPLLEHEKELCALCTKAKEKVCKKN